MGDGRGFMKRYVIIGNGVAGARAALKIRETDPKGEVHIFTEEACPFYYRVRFPELVAGEISIKDLIIHSKGFYENNLRTFVKMVSTFCRCLNLGIKSSSNLEVPSLESEEIR